MTAYNYACCEFPGMEDCPGKVQAASKDELWQLIAIHARVAHGEEMSEWSEADREQVSALIRTVD